MRTELALAVIALALVACDPAPRAVDGIVKIQIYRDGAVSVSFDVERGVVDDPEAVASAVASTLFPDGSQGATDPFARGRGASVEVLAAVPAVDSGLRFEIPTSHVYDTVRSMSEMDDLALLVCPPTGYRLVQSRAVDALQRCAEWELETGRSRPDVALVARSMAPHAVALLVATLGVAAMAGAAWRRSRRRGWDVRSSMIALAAGSAGVFTFVLGIRWGGSIQALSGLPDLVRTVIVVLELTVTMMVAPLFGVLGLLGLTRRARARIPGRPDVRTA